MTTPILATKLYVPTPRPNAVARPRLVARLDEGLRGKLALVSAPAGFGKTTLVSEWLAGCERPATWLSLDEADGDPMRFLAYLVAALRTVAAGLGEGVLAALDSSQPPPAESLLTALLNEIATLPDDFVLVLDDYHALDSAAVDQALAFLIERQPPQMHLVVTTREDPQLPLARLRARGQLVEVRAADLRFTPAEAAEFLNRVMDLDLSTEEVAALEARTEGWIAGLQLAALSMRGREDVSAFVQAFAGDNRYIMDYLVEEVLQRQPERVRSFLLQTSILDRLSGPLCDAVTGRSDGTALLDALERGNLFVAPLDDRRRWFRYHHLFADVLAAHAQQEQPAQVPALHRRASAWYAVNGSPGDAIRHALAAKDFAGAADALEAALPAIRKSRQEAALLGWLQALPDELVRARPVLSLHYVGALLQSGRIEGVESRLRDAERWLGAPGDMDERPDAPPKMVVVDQAEFRRLPAWTAIYRAAIALFQGNVHETARSARRALDLLVEDDPLGHGAATTLLGLAHWTSGELEAARRAYAVGMAGVQRAGYISDAIGCALALADIQIAQGRLHEAMRTYERGLQLATEQGALPLRGAADMYVGMSELHRERGNLDAAEQSLLRCGGLGEFAGLPQNPYRRRLAMARIRQAQGDLDGAIDLLQEAERLYAGDFSPNVRPVAAFTARIWVAQGRLGEALGWARARGLSAHDEPSYLREFEHVTLARVLLARHQAGRAGDSLDEAVGLLARLLNAAQERGGTGSAIEILALLALARQAQGDITAALAALGQALALAEPEGYVRTFADEGAPMAGLLRQAAAHAIMPAYAGRLLAAYGAQPERSADEAPRPTAPAAQPLVEPLSQRELDVLRLFQTELSGPEIARELVVALSTVRTHTKSIYSKLNVNSRRAAVKRATELRLL